jgi:hypothetical protein
VVKRGVKWNLVTSQKCGCHRARRAVREFAGEFHGAGFGNGEAAGAVALRELRGDVAIIRRCEREECRCVFSFVGERIEQRGGNGCGFAVVYGARGSEARHCCAHGGLDEAGEGRVVSILKLQ